MLVEQAEGLVLRAVFQGFERNIGSDGSRITRVLHRITHFDHPGVVVLALPDEDVPVVEAGGRRLQVPFAHYGGVVAGLLEQFGEGGLGAVEGVPVVAHAVDMAVFPGEEDGPAGSADGIGDETVLEQGAFPCQPVDVRCFDKCASIAADGLLGMVVRHDKEDVGLLRNPGRTAGHCQGEGKKGYDLIHTLFFAGSNPGKDTHFSVFCSERTIIRDYGPEKGGYFYSLPVVFTYLALRLVL